MTFWVATALLYPTVRRGIDWFVDHVVLERPDYRLLHTRIGGLVRNHQEVPALLDEVCALLAPALSARVVRWREPTTDESPHIDLRDGAGVAASVDIPVSESPRFVIDVSDLTGGRRLLSDDQSALDAIAGLVARRIDAIRLAHERYEREIREQEIGKLATEAELRALRAQINPHFLFNALTTIGYLIQAAPARALDTLMRLTSLLRSVLRSEAEVTTLGRELELVESYLSIEHARFEERLRVTIDVPASLRDILLPPLVLQPIVENAVKHGISPQRRGGAVTVTGRIEPTPDDGAMLVLTVRDTGAGASPERLREGRRLGVGLSNVARRLESQYGSAATLSVTSEAGVGTTAEIRVPAEVPTGHLLASRSAS